MTDFKQGDTPLSHAFSLMKPKASYFGGYCSFSICLTIKILK